MSKPTVSKHWRKPVGRWDQAWIPPEPLHHVTIIQLQENASTHSIRVQMWQTQSVGHVRTAHISVLRTVNIVSHNPAQSCSDNIPSQSPDNHHNSDVIQQRGGKREYWRQACHKNADNIACVLTDTLTHSHSLSNAEHTAACYQEQLKIPHNRHTDVHTRQEEVRNRQRKCAMKNAYREWKRGTSWELGRIHSKTMRYHWLLFMCTLAVWFSFWFMF